MQIEQDWLAGAALRASAIWDAQNEKFVLLFELNVIRVGDVEITHREVWQVFVAFACQPLFWIGVIDDDVGVEQTEEQEDIEELLHLLWYGWTFENIYI